MFLFKLSLFCFTVFLANAAHAEKISVAAAADLKFALDEIVGAFMNANPGDEVAVIYGSSGKFYTQIQQGAPYDLYFSADIAYPRELAAKGLAASPVVPYAVGRIVLWSQSLEAAKWPLDKLGDSQITRIAIANPKHAPYGKRAEEALRAAGVWKKVEPKLVYGENVAHTVQFVQTGNAQLGIIALALALSPELVKKGSYSLIPEHMHQPLEQAFIMTRRAADSALSRRFAAYMDSRSARAVMVRYGFTLPGENAVKP